MIQAGSIFSFPDDPHTWVVVTSPDANGNVACVNFTTVKAEGTDMTTPCPAGCHSTVPKPSAIYYGGGIVAPAAHVEKRIAAGDFTQYEDCEPALLGRIQAGVLTSPRASEKIVNAFKAAQPKQAPPYPPPSRP